MAAIMTDVNAIVTGLVTGTGSVIGAVMDEGNEILAFGVLFGFAFGVVGFARKLFGL